MIDEDGLMIINKSGVMIRMQVEAMRVMGRATQGVKLINLKDDDQISSVAKVEIGQEETDKSSDMDIKNDIDDNTSDNIAKDSESLNEIQNELDSSNELDDDV